MKNPDWAFWGGMEHVQTWQACALSCNIDPDTMQDDQAGWMGGPGGGPIFEPESFPSEEIEKQFEKRLRLLAAHFSNPKHFTIYAISVGEPAHCQIYLSHFAAWAVQEMQWSDLPPELVAMARKPNSGDGTKGTEQKMQDGSYSTPTLVILNGAISEFFEPRRDRDAKREEVVDWIKAKMIAAEMADSENIAAAIFTIIKPADHHPRKRRG
jgi:hypothetical protein